MAKLKNVRVALRDMHYVHYSNIEHILAQKRDELGSCFRDLQLNLLSPTLIKREKVVSQEFCKSKDAKTKILIQRAKLHDIKHGDLISFFFFSKIKERQQTQIIHEIQDTNEDTHIGMPAVRDAFVNYYHQLFFGGNGIDPDIIANGHCLDTQDINALVTPITRKEIKDGLFSINSHKSPRLDGFSAGSFKSVWDIIANDFCLAVEDFFRTSFMPKQLNVTVLTLFPKKKFV
ncbi:uncharacterized protein LOC141620270 [Silene latifolia]|uniref:uncharacterized protein LOC141620270 n=1 Tax=Silene latifolia TaxID=37657 RepID=UPI003D77E7C2